MPEGLEAPALLVVSDGDEDGAVGVVVVLEGLQTDGSGSHAAAAHPLARNFLALSFLAALHRMQ